MIVSHGEGCDRVSKLIPVADTLPDSFSSESARRLCAELEAGNIVFLPRSPFNLSENDRTFLLGQTQNPIHKNVAYRPEEGRVTGFEGSPDQKSSLEVILRGYSDGVMQLLSRALEPYAGHWRRDFATFRPLEERNRDLRLRRRNDLLHVDAFPTRPTRGDRILRVFTNLNPSEPRVWITSETLEGLAPRFAPSVGLPGGPTQVIRRWWARVKRLTRLTAAELSPYDHLMIRLHNRMKEDGDFQRSCPKNRWEFPPGSSWIVFTDMVSHAVLSGRFALEQTFIVPRQALVRPEKAPIRILESLYGCSLS